MVVAVGGVVAVPAGTVFVVVVVGVTAVVVVGVGFDGAVLLAARLLFVLASLLVFNVLGEPLGALEAQPPFWGAAVTGVVVVVTGCDGCWVVVVVLEGGVSLAMIFGVGMTNPVDLGPSVWVVVFTGSGSFVGVVCSGWGVTVVGCVGCGVTGVVGATGVGWTWVCCGGGCWGGDGSSVRCGCATSVGWTAAANGLLCCSSSFAFSASFCFLRSSIWACKFVMRVSAPWSCWIFSACSLINFWLASRTSS